MASAGIDEAAVANWIAELGIGATGPLTFERIGNGQSNLTNLVTDAGGAKWILRRPPLGKLLASAHDVVREHRILSALQGSAVPVPKVLGLNEDPAVTDAPLMLMSYVDGTVVDDVAVAERLSVERRAAIGASLTKTLGARVPLLGQIPLDTRLREAGDAGAPIVLAQPDAPAAQALEKIAEGLAVRSRGLSGMSLGLTPVRR